MVLYIPPDEYEFAFVHSQVGTTEQAVVTCGVRFPDPIDIAGFGAVNLAWINHMLPLFSNQVSLVEIKCRSNEGNVFNGGFNIPGGETDPCASYNNAYLVHKETETVGRRGRGRMYLPGVNELDTAADGKLSPTLTAALQPSIDAFWDAITLIPANLTLFHNKVIPTDTPPSSVILALSLDARTASQRGRLRR